MKRRNAESGKMRRPVKRNKIAESIFGSSLLYLRFLILWSMILLADFIVEFRFEFLWPFWMLLRSIYDSFKYQGLAFCLFFVCIALTSDMIFYFFIPVQWVFFAASTYVWLQFIWHTDKGICLPTMILCSLLVYVEGGVRLRDLRHMPAHVDLCRPFAAHCIGYPVVTLGFGLKSYVSHRMRIRRQKQVAKENGFYMQLLQEALPPSAHVSMMKDNMEKSALSIEKISESTNMSNSTAQNHVAEKHHMNGGTALHASAGHGANSTSVGVPQSSGSGSSVSTNSSSNTSYSRSSRKCDNVSRHTNTGQDKSAAASVVPSSDPSPPNLASSDVASSQSSGGKSSQVVHPSNKQQFHGNGSVAHGVGAQPEHSEGETATPQPERTLKGSKCSANKTDKKESLNTQKEESRKKNKNKDNSNSSRDKESTREKEKELKETTNAQKEKENCVYKEKESLHRERETHKEKEIESQKEKDTHRERENKKDREKEKEKEELHLKHLEHKENYERQIRQLRSEISQLRSQNEQLSARVNAARAAERAAISSAERRLSEERRRAEGCRQRRAALETDVTTLRQQLLQARERGQRLERDLQTAEHQVSCLESKLRENGPEAWRTAFNSLRDRAQQLERSLSAETKIKMDLFSAVGEAKRLSGLKEGVIRSQEKEIEELKGKIAQMLAVMPSDPFPQSSYHMQVAHGHPHQQPPSINPLSNLDPNATAYTPKSINQPTIKG